MLTNAFLIQNRPYGPTAISPGLGRIKLSIRQNHDSTPSASTGAPTAESALLASIFQPRLSDYGLPTTSTSTSTFPPTLAPSHKTNPSPSAVSATSETSHLGLLEPHSRLPRADLREKLFDVFFERFQSMWPFMDRRAVDEQIRRGGEVGVVMLANTMCALAARWVGWGVMGVWKDAVLMFRCGTGFATFQKSWRSTTSRFAEASHSRITRNSYSSRCWVCLRQVSPLRFCS